MTANSLDEVDALLRGDRSPKEIFGDDPKKTYHLLARLTHPDPTL